MKYIQLVDSNGENVALFIVPRDCEQDFNRVVEIEGKDTDYLLEVLEEIEGFERVLVDELTIV